MEKEKLGNEAHPSGSLISIRNLTKSYVVGESRDTVLSGLNYEINQGETIAIVGESGVGKSTLLHIIGTLDSPDSGDIFFSGNNIFEYDRLTLADFRNKNIGFVFQFHHLLGGFSTIENVMMPLLIGGTDQKLAKSSAEEVLIRVGLKDRMDYSVSDLSGGQQQRVAIARALVRSPKLLLADEPTGNLDRKSSERVHELLMELNHELNMTMIVVTHNIHLASHMSKTLTLSDGILVHNI